MSKTAVEPEGLSPAQQAMMAAFSGAMTESVKAAIEAMMPKPVQEMSAVAFASMDLPRPPIPTFQNGVPIDLRGVQEPTLSQTMKQLGELPSGSYLDGLFRITRTEPTLNTEGRLDIRYDSSLTEKRMNYVSRVRDFSDLVDQMWREAHPRGAKVA